MACGREPHIGAPLWTHHRRSINLKAAKPLDLTVPLNNHRKYRRSDRVTDRAFLKWDSCTLDMLRCTEVSQPTDGMGHSRPMHSAPAPINVRCSSNGAIIIRRSAVTLGPI